MLATDTKSTLDDELALRQTVQVLPNAKKNPYGDGGEFFSFQTQRGTLLPPVGTRQREYALRRLYHNELNWMGQSAFSGLTKKWASASFQIIGKNRVDYFQDVLRHADFNRGWTSFIQKIGLNYLRYDSGAFVEVIAPGDPLRPPTGPVTGLAVLPTLRCWPTGDPDYPILYIDRYGKRHLMHRTRVFQLVDSPDADDSWGEGLAFGRAGYGKCALSRAVAIVAQQCHMNNYIDMKLDENPMPGFVVASNLNKVQRDLAVDQYLHSQSSDAGSPIGRTVWFYGIDPTQPADLKIITFVEPPDNFDFEQYTDIHVNAWALALGVDVQELWQLKGGNLGSSQQSKVLHSNGQNKTFGLFLIELERILNDILPASLELKFGVRDNAADAERATAADLWAQFVAVVAPFTSADEIRRLLASNVSAYRDAVTDTAGNIVALGDADPEDPAQIASDATPNELNAPAKPAAAPAQPSTEPSQQPRTKALADDRDRFETDFAAIVKDFQDGDLTRTRAQILLRALIAKYGQSAYLDGMKDGGLMKAAPDDGDKKALLLLLGLSAPFVRKFLTSAAERALSPEALASHAVSWWNKSISPYLYQGRLTANPAKLYEFVGVDGLESCDTCQSLKGRKMSMAGWTAARLRPGVDTEGYTCGGWECQHFLRPVGASKEHGHD